MQFPVPCHPYMCAAELQLHLQAVEASSHGGCPRPCSCQPPCTCSFGGDLEPDEKRDRLGRGSSTSVTSAAAASDDEDGPVWT